MPLFLLGMRPRGFCLPNVYLIPHRQAFDKHFMKAVEFDGHALNPSSRLGKHLKEMNLHERSRSIEFNKDLKG